MSPSALAPAKCPFCSYEWQPRVRAPKKCPRCTLRLDRASLGRRTKRRLAAVAIAIGLIGWSAAPAWASCSTHTIMSGGRIVTCTTCCSAFGGSCVTTCF